jgi:hypothetical protein
MRDAFAELMMRTLRTATRIGEFRDLTEHGCRGPGVVGGANPWFHVPRDTPDTVQSGLASCACSAAHSTD